MDITKLTTTTYLDEMTAILYHWWGKNEGWSKNKLSQYLSHSLNSDKLPITFVAMQDKMMVGFCQLSYQDLDTRPDLYPWICNLYVIEKYRHQNVAKSLLAYVEKEAKQLGFQKLYLYTTLDDFYEKLGYQLYSYENTYIPSMAMQKIYIKEL